MKQKQCFKCLEIKPLSLFYRHKQMGDGHLNKCKDCTKRDVRKNRNDNIDYYREYDKGRANIPSRVFARTKYQKTDSGKIAANKAKRLYVEKNTIKRAAHLLVNNAIRGGIISKQSICSECGCSGKIHGHHDDYSLPLVVRWLCARCHSAWHKEHGPGKNG